ncbi:Uma2 family endonuclease [Streptomyces sp. B1866]|uniref:Uma2 family endonuclease n=1 Tax=Streptomyces sp. B1866 TaxID=3075431 RepID=UPI00288CCBEE|nr:Uma2 family endonuclease [Streptomyces sp. B1866]MDT3397301.1 Uma2 family endonuclease [Streptomyces sp. B1866]
MTVVPQTDEWHAPKEWPVPPPGGYVAEDLDKLPNLPPHTELIDGSLVFVSPQTAFHVLVMRLLERRLVQAVPTELHVFREMTVKLGPRDRPVPDLLVTRAEAYTGPGQTTYAPQDVVLAIEVVSADSEARDRETKPRKYVEAGIPHFWRVEEETGLPVVHVFEREPTTRAYVATGIHRERLKASVPFPVDIDLTAIGP